MCAAPVRANPKMLCTGWGGVIGGRGRRHPPFTLRGVAEVGGICTPPQVIYILRLKCTSWPRGQGGAEIVGAWSNAPAPRTAGLNEGVVSGGGAFFGPTPVFAHTARVPSPSAAEEKSTGSILDDIGSMFDDLADQLDAMLE